MLKNVMKFSMVLLLSLSAGLTSPSTTTCSASPDSSVVLTPAEADSIAAALVNQEVRLRLLQADLDECRALARYDSIAAADRLRLEQQPWYDKLVRHPILWFVIGVYMGIQVDRVSQ